MYYLIIDASPKKTLVAYGDSAKIIAFREWEAGIKLSKELLPAIEKIMARRSRPAAIFCVTGPGSFTGLRIAVSTANALGYAWRIPVVPVEAFEIYEAAQKTLKAPYTVVLDNIKDLVYVKSVSEGKARYTVEKFKIHNSKCKSGESIGFVATGKAREAGNIIFDSKEISGEVRAKLIIAVARKRMKSFDQFHQPIVPLYINPPKITPKK